MSAAPALLPAQRSHGRLHSAGNQRINRFLNPCASLRGDIPDSYLWLGWHSQHGKRGTHGARRSMTASLEPDTRQCSVLLSDVPRSNGAQRRRSFPRPLNGPSPQTSPGPGDVGVLDLRIGRQAAPVSTGTIAACPRPCSRWPTTRPERRS